VKVFDAKTLVDSMEARAKQYQELRENLEQLKQKCQDVVNLDENFKGEGATAIKEYYQAQIDVIEAWISLITKLISFFNGIAGTTEARDLAGDTVIYISFLEDELPHSANLSEEIVLNQHSTLTSIFKRIGDLIELEAFSKDRFEESTDRAEMLRRDTILALDNLDHELKTEYQTTEADEQYVTTLFRQLQESSRQGVQISPLHFNNEAFKTSEVYQLKKQADLKAKEYLSFKGEQEKFREELRKQKELDNQLANDNKTDKNEFTID
jgi:predicted ribonuclease toxin of YeeF-YezG toxin-antitoxin module